MCKKFKTISSEELIRREECKVIRFFHGLSQKINGTSYSLKEFNELLGLQWLITYRSTNIGNSFREIEVTTESDVHLHYPAGYKPKP